MTKAKIILGLTAGVLAILIGIDQLSRPDGTTFCGGLLVSAVVIEFFMIRLKL